MLIERQHVAKAAAVVVSGVSHAFGVGVGQKPVLAGIELTLDPGEFVVLTGPSGAGKTTLMTLIGALRAPQSGSIRVLGTELVGLAAAGQRKVRRHIGFIFQDHNLFDALTTWQTLSLAAELADERSSPAALMARSTALLATLGIGQHLHAKPRALSTGEKQRVAIARALINDPPIILADEPTASLDRDSALSVIDLLKRRTAERGATVLMVTHDNRIFAAANRVVQMIDGRIV